MKYLGSKNRIAKELKPVIESYINANTTQYIEPFVGGANMIDKIGFDRKVGSDVNRYLIAILQYAQDLSNVLPTTISEDEYTAVKANKDAYDDWYVGLAGFCASYSAVFFGTYARAFKNDGVTRRDMAAEGIRNLAKQRTNLVGIEFSCKSYEAYNGVKGAVIYCDPPYRKTAKYNGTAGFNHDAFYAWCVEMAKNNTVLISEYEMPSDQFECVWEKEHSVNVYSKRSTKSTRIERLYTVKKTEEQR